VWRWESDPFGVGSPDENGFTFNLRFPGQYFDQETGLFHNYFRDYDPQTGRYIQADPIGLAGGTNLYNYAEGNPLTFYDPHGLGATDGSANTSTKSEYDENERICKAGGGRCTAPTTCGATQRWEFPPEVVTADRMVNLEFLETSLNIASTTADVTEYALGGSKLLIAARVAGIGDPGPPPTPLVRGSIGSPGFSDGSKVRVRLQVRPAQCFRLAKGRSSSIVGT
jgi:RHS repeat-associated protein